MARTDFHNELHTAAIMAVERGGNPAKLIKLIGKPQFSWDETLWRNASGPLGLMEYTYTYQKWSEVDLVKTLLEAGADIHQKDKAGVPLWHKTLLCPAKLNLYLERGVDPNQFHPHPLGTLIYPTALTKVAMGNSTPGADMAGSLHLLLDYGANIDAQDKQGYTALHHAVERGQLPLAQLLLERGANPFLQNNVIGNCTAYDIALRKSISLPYFVGFCELLNTYMERTLIERNTVNTPLRVRSGGRL